MQQELKTALTALSSSDETERIYAAEDLGTIGEETAIDPLLIQFARDNSVAVRETISQALYEFDTPVVVEKVTEWLYSDVAATRNLAVRFLQSKGELNCDFLSSLFHSDPDPDIRKFIIDAAMKFSRENCARFLKCGIKDEDINVRIAAIEYAGQRQIDELEDNIIELLSSVEEPMLISSILESLSNFNDAKTFNAIKKRFATLEDDELYYAPWIARFYGAQGRSEDLDYLLSLLNTCPGQIDGVLAKGISMMLIRLTDVPIPDSLYPWFEALFDQSQDDAAINHTIQLLLNRRENKAAQYLLFAAINTYNKRTRILAITAIVSDNEKNIFRAELIKRLRVEPDLDVKEILSNAIG